jgi:isocitrate dehydrogenase (NAD+)
MKITVIKGDGISGEVVDCALRILEKLDLPLEWEFFSAGEAVIKEAGKPLTDETLASIARNKVALKGPIATPIGKGFRSVNVELRQKFDLFCNLRPSKSIDGVKTRFDNVDLVMIRENTEDLYMGIERMADENTAESIKLFTRSGCERIVRFAFDYAVKQGRKKVTAVHKANIMKLTDGMFLDVARAVANEYPQIVFDERIVDAMAMRLVTDPENFDVIVTSNLYGDILSDLCAGLTGGLGLAPSANIGKDIAIFEPVHGSAPDIAGKGIANPTATVFAACLMLQHLGYNAEAERIENAVKAVLKEGKALTPDLKGAASSKQFTDAVLARM